MNANQVIKQGKLNCARLKLALEQGSVLHDTDDIRDLTHPHSLRHWDLTIPLETRLRMFKLRSEAWNKQ